MREDQCVGACNPVTAEPALQDDENSMAKTSMRRALWWCMKIALIATSLADAFDRVVAINQERQLHCIHR
jgi:hypothetical protein